MILDASDFQNAIQTKLLKEEFKFEKLFLDLLKERSWILANKLLAILTLSYSNIYRNF